jgi:pterin-4a-carbinolamine dehydratase
MSTLEGGWRLLDSTEKDMTTTTINNLHESSMTDTATVTAPKFLQKQCYHHTLHDASRFLSHISLVATNINHYPFLSMERILVDDVNNIHERGDNQMDDQTGTTDISSLDIDNSGNNEVPRKRKRKIKGWAFRSTIRCSTYRPPASGSNSQDMNKSESLHKDKGLTYHDFHLAMSVDIEVNRKEVKHLFWSAPQEE